MPPLLYPESTWFGRFGRFVRTLQIVALAGAVGAIGGGAGMLAFTGSGPPHKPVIVGASSDNAAQAVDAAKVVGAAHGAPQSAAPAAASAVPAASPASVTPQPDRPAAAPPAQATPQPSQLAGAAALAVAAAPQATGSAGAPASSGLYNRAEPAEHSAHARIAKLRAKENRRAKSMISRYAREQDRRDYDRYGWGDQSESSDRNRSSDWYGPNERGAGERGIEADAIPRRGYPPRSTSWGGGPTFGGGWGND
jgi:hypothetical protein